MISPQLRSRVFQRDNYTCQMCGQTPRDDGAKLEIGHLTAKCHGGPDREENLITLCRTCNRGTGETDIVNISVDNSESTRKKTTKKTVSFALTGQKTFLDEDIDRIRRAYPRQVEPEAAKRAIRRAIIRLSAQKKIGVKQSAEEILKATISFAASAAGRAGGLFHNYVPANPAKWFNGGRYLDAEKDWKPAGNFAAAVDAPAPATSELERARACEIAADELMRAEGVKPCPYFKSPRPTPAA